jgi:hypothetical protein
LPASLQRRVEVFPIAWLKKDETHFKRSADEGSRGWRPEPIRNMQAAPARALRFLKG